jgi:hypothetical protein
MKKALSIVSLVLLAFTFTATEVSAATWEYSDVEVYNGKEYLVEYSKTGNTDTSFRGYSEIMNKPTTYVKTGNTTVAHFTQHVISGSLEFEAKAGTLFTKVGVKLTVGYAYTTGSSYSTTYNWEYKPTDYGDKAIYGVKHAATEYTYQIREHKTKQVCVNTNSFGNCTAYETQETSEWSTTVLESGTFWQHSKYGEIGLYSYLASREYYVLNSLNKGEFSPYMVEVD